MLLARHFGLQVVIDVPIHCVYAVVPGKVVRDARSIYLPPYKTLAHDPSQVKCDWLAAVWVLVARYVRPIYLPPYKT